jgi:5-methylcytosine-specific restriction enzyme subunit McrC
MIQVREYGRITTVASATPSLDCGVVSSATFEWLQDLAAGWKGSDAIAVINGRHSLKLGSYVGFLQSPTGEAIEILPKTDMGIEDPQAARKVLQRMLLTALGIKPRQAAAADLMRIRQPLHEWIFSQFLSELHALVRRGLRFDYERIQEESRFIRGQLEMARQQRQPPGREHLFHISHDIFSPNRLENRLLKTALEYVSSVCKDGENWRLAHELSHRLADVPAEPVPLQTLPQWKSNKLMQAYETVRPWCELILEKLNPNFQQGLHRGISLLFPMEQLFEKYIEASLAKNIAIGARLKSQASSAYLLRHTPINSDIAGNMFQLKPDLLLQSTFGNQILDAKWKLIDQGAFLGGEKYGISQGDLYQLFAYGHKYQDGSGHMMLIYPKHDAFDKALPPFNYSDELVVWAVPFCLESASLVTGNWEAFFPFLKVPDLSATIKPGDALDLFISI